MATEVVMPQMGESIAEGTITKWLVKVGDKVEQDQPLFEISTDKVDAEIPSPAAGTLLEIKHEEGETVEVDQVVALIGEEGEAPAAAAEKKEEEKEKKEKKKAAAEEKKGKKKEPEKKKTEKEAAKEREARPREKTEEKAEPKEVTAQEAAVEAEPIREEMTEEERIRRYSSPLVRRMAQEEGVDLSQVKGSGIHGRVTKQDMLAYLEERQKAPAAPAAAEAPAAAARPVPEFHVPAYSEGERVEIEPMSKIRQITAAHMVYSKATSAHVTTVFHIDMSRVARVRSRAKAKFQEVNGTKLTFMPFIFKATTEALKAHKKVNAAVDGTDIVYKKDINLGMAVALEWGLIVPVIKNADQLSLVGLAKAANDLAERARGKKLKPEEIQGGTFTITNPGVFGSLFGTPIINQPQVAIMGIGTIEKRPVVVTHDDGNDAIVIKTMSYFSISYDHRLVDGADADLFMIDVKKTLEEEDWAELDPYM